MKLSVDKHEKYIILKLEEEKLESLIAPDLKSQLLVSNAEGFRNMILDLSNIKYVDSSGLSAILTGNRICNASGGTFVLANVQANVKKLIEISQLTSILNAVPTVEEAVDYVFIEELERDLSSNHEQSAEETED